MPSRLGTNVEVLMKPAFRRHQQAAGMPIVSFELFALSPHHRKALTLENDHVRSRTMAVGFLVGPYWELRDMGRHNVVGHLNHDQSATGAPIFSFYEFEASHIANKIRVRESCGRHLHIAVEKILLAVVAVDERIIALENEIDVVKEVQTG